MVEANDVKTLLDGPAKFGMVNDFESVPIFDITEAVAVQNEALDGVAPSRRATYDLREGVESASARRSR